MTTTPARYDVWKHDDTGTKRVAEAITASAAAKRLRLAADDVRWAIEEYGRCDDGTYTVKIAGSRKPRPHSMWHVARGG